MKFLSLLTLSIGMICHISACGQKGPLFIPAKPPAISTPYPTAISNDASHEVEKLPDPH